MVVSPGKQTVRAGSGQCAPPRPNRRSSRPAPRPRLTPMIDVTFLLLLFFLLAFTFRQAEGLIPGSLPRDVGHPGELTITITVRLPSFRRPDGVVFQIVGDPKGIRSAEQLYAELLKKRRVCSTGTPVIIDASDVVRWEHVVDAFNQATHAKFEKIGFAS